MVVRVEELMIPSCVGDEWQVFFVGMDIRRLRLLHSCLSHQVTTQIANKRFETDRTNRYALCPAAQARR